MRRLTAICAVLAALAVAAAVVSAPATSDDSYRVDAIFDTAKGVVPGQLVKIAGARVGEIADVTLTEDYRARITMTVPRRFTFRADARCDIQPEGLISENFVQCDPGSPQEDELRADGEGAPTVPVERTAVPVSLTDLFRIFQADVRQRFTVAMAAVGGGLAARGSDLNEIIRRANPTLAAIRTLTEDLAAQREQLKQAVADTDRVVAALAERRGSVAGFIEQAERVSARTARRSTEIAQAIERLPPLLDATDATSGELRRLAVAGRPLLGRLRAAAPDLETLLARVGPFTGAARPALRDLARLSDTARPIVRRAVPVVALLRRFAREAGPTGTLLARTLVDLRERGFVEHLNLFAYYGAAAQARFDGLSHIFPAHPNFSSCSPHSEEPVEGCNAFYNPSTEPAGDEPQQRRARAPRRAREERADRPRRSPERSRDEDRRPRLPGLPEALDPVEELAEDLAGPLADRLTDQLEQTLPKGLDGALRRGEAGALEGLTDFLLGP